jgi:NitT/TauT family transport system permease protein
VKRHALPLLFGVAVLLVWEGAVRWFDIPRILLPPPSAIVDALLADPGTLFADLNQTFLHSTLLGLAAGSLAGFAAALLVDRSGFLRRGFVPLASLAGALPIVGIAPIAIMWFGFDWPSKAAVVAALTFFPSFVQMVAGLESIGALERDLLHALAASRGQMLRLLQLPASLPFLFAALKVNAVLALTGAVVAEFFGTPTVGMGFRISTEAARMNIDRVWAMIVVVALCGSGSYALLALAERRFTAWHRS